MQFVSLGAPSYSMHGLPGPCMSRRNTPIPLVLCILTAEQKCTNLENHPRRDDKAVA